jgi:hypothetical protein
MEIRVSKHVDESGASSETEDGHQNSLSDRYASLVPQLRDKEFRHAYASTHTRQFLARQIRAFRGDKPQKEFGEILGQKQNAISRLEDPNYGRETLQTLFTIAEKLDVVFIGRFVDFQTFLRMTDDMSDEAARPEPYDETKVDEFAKRDPPTL